MGMYNKEPLTEFGLACAPGSSMTKQSMTPETDINNILKKFQKTGMIEHLAKGEPFYGDVSEIADYQSALNKVQEAEDLFMSMSPDVRERFDNDPAKMIDFLSDPRNTDKAIELGMAAKRPEKPVEEPKVAEGTGAPIGKS